MVYEPTLVMTGISSMGLIMVGMLLVCGLGTLILKIAGVKSTARALGISLLVALVLLACVVVAVFLGGPTFLYTLGSHSPGTPYVDPPMQWGIFNPVGVLGGQGWFVFQLTMDLFFSSLAIACALGLIIQMYRKWIQDDLSEAERRPGIDGVKAWLSQTNVLLCAGFGLGAWLGFGASFLEYFLLSLMVVCAYPTIQLLASRQQVTIEQDLSQARAKILSLLENGTITVAESRELLAALGDTIEPGSSDREEDFSATRTPPGSF